MRWGRLALAAAVATTAHGPARGEGITHAGPYDATLIRVVDGDTLEMRVEVWPGLVAEVFVRVRGIDAPDVPNDGCAEGVAFEREVDEWVEATLAGQRLRLEAVSKGSFAGRVVADVMRSPGERWFSLGDALLRRGYAVPFEEGADPPWCLLARTRAD